MNLLLCKIIFLLLYSTFADQSLQRLASLMRKCSTSAKKSLSSTAMSDAAGRSFLQDPLQETVAFLLALNPARIHQSSARNIARPRGWQTSNNFHIAASSDAEQQSSRSNFPRQAFAGLVSPISGKKRHSDLLMNDAVNTADDVIILSGERVKASDIKVAVFGGGSFGTAMACVLGRKGIKTTLVVRKKEVVDSINDAHINPYHQSDLLLPSLVRATNDPAEAFQDADFIVHAVPMQASRQALEGIKHLIRPEVPIVSLTKGIETSTLSFMSDIIPEVLGPNQPVAYLSGPSFAAEIVTGISTAVVVASTDPKLAKNLISLFSSSSFRTLYTPDVIGVEVGGAVKNVIAIAAGMSTGLGLGTNAISALVTRGCGEMRRLVKSLGGKSSTVFGLAGIGDTYGTCFGPLSRNRQVGYRLGKGETLEEILDSMSEVAEGVETARSLRQLLDKHVKGYRKDLKYPILYGVSKILDGEISAREGLVLLMERYPLRLEEHPF